MKSDTETLIKALRVLVRDIQSDDGVANAAISEAADRLEEQQERIKRLEKIGHAMAERVALKVAKCRNCDGTGQNNDGENWINEACPDCEEDRIIMAIFDDQTKDAKP